MATDTIMGTCPPREGELHAMPLQGGIGNLRERWFLTVVCFVSFTLMVIRLLQGLIPASDSIFGHMTEGGLWSELPKADFYEKYAGGLSVLHTGIFRVFGVNLLAPRLVLLVFFMAWVPSFWYVARRITSAIGASVISLLAVTWSVPLYPSPLPFWYNLYFATFGTAALLRYLNSRRARWLFLAGLMGGLSSLVKMSGLYFLAAACVFLIFDEQSVQDTVRYRERTVQDSVLSVIVTLVLVGFDILTLRLIEANPDHLTGLYHFVAPATALSFLLMVREWREPRFASSVRMWQLAGRLLPLLMGALLPVVLFLPYAYSGDIKSWFAGSLVLPPTAFPPAFQLAAHPISAICCVPLFLVLVLNSKLQRTWSRRVALAVLSGALFCLLLAILRHPLIGLWAWVSVGTIIPLITLVGVFVLLHGSVKGIDAARLVLLLSVTAVCSLVELPTSGPLHFCFVAPLAILALAELARTTASGSRISLLTPFAVFYAALLLVMIMPSWVANSGLSQRSAPQVGRDRMTTTQLWNPRNTAEFCCPEAPPEHLHVVIRVMLHM